MPIRVQNLQLKLRLPAELDCARASLRSRAESQFVPSVLEELSELLHREFGAQAIVRVALLRFNFSTPVDALADAGVSRQLARDLFESLAQEVRSASAAERLRPESPRIVVFTSTAHRSAAHIASVLDRRARAWFVDGDSTVEALIAAARRQGIAELRELVAWLQRMDRWQPLLRELPREAAEQLRREVAATADASLDPSVHAEPAQGAASPSAPSEGLIATRAPDAPRSASALPVELAVSPAPALPALEPPARPLDVREPSLAAALPEGLSQEHPGASPRLAGESPHAAPPAADSDHLTEAAGLFYLIRPVLTLDMAEALWAAGIHEGPFLAAVARLFTPAEDPAWRWFGGCFDTAPQLPAVETWAADEVNERVVNGLGRALVKLNIVRTPAGLSAELDQVLRELPDASCDSPAQRLLARCGAAWVVWVCARLGEPPAFERVRQLVRQSGALVLEPAQLRVVLPATALDITLRRAGLDQDVAWVPWLQRAVRFEFTGMQDW